MLRQPKQPKKKPKYQSTIKRTLHYFLKANWKYKWYAIAILIVTPIVIFVRQILSPLVIANVIGILSSAGPEDFINNGNIFQIPLVQKILPQGIFLFLCQLVGSAIFWQPPRLSRLENGTSHYQRSLYPVLRHHQ